MVNLGYTEWKRLVLFNMTMIHPLKSSFMVAVNCFQIANNVVQVYTAYTCRMDATLLHPKI